MNEEVGCGSSTVAVVRWEAGAQQPTSDCVATEMPVALVYNGVSHVVMMATPADLEAFALGFSFTEGIISRVEEIFEIEVAAQPAGCEVSIRLSGERFAELQRRRRNLIGRTGCGLCGAESLEQAIRPLPTVPSERHFRRDAIEAALEGLSAQQPLQQQTGAVHAAAWVDSDGDIRLVREDVGRHNALDKLIGALLQEQTDNNGFLLVSSRASYEMVSKAVMAGCEMLVAISAPTSLAIELAQRSDLTLVGFARPGRYSIYTHPHRLLGE